jgi:ArsR family transcriptional regulator, lead/cadmium/zinc/bismuth-responsive transcriptional repressor
MTLPCGKLAAVHLVPADRADRRIIDGERVCEAIAALWDPESVQARAREFAVLGDPTRLSVLICIAATGPISVSDLSVATGVGENTISGTLRYLRASGAVTAERDGRIVRYVLADDRIRALVEDAGRSSGPPERLTRPRHRL